MRFSLHTSDGRAFVIKDRGRVFTRGVLVGRIQQAVEKRIKGDVWRDSLRRMCSQWRGHQNQHYKDSRDVSGWEWWSKVRSASWRNRSRAVVNAIRRCDYSPNAELHVQGRVNKKRSKVVLNWEHAYLWMSRNYRTQWSRYDGWKKWSINTASNQRKRMRNKAEREETRAWLVGYTKDD